MKPDSYTTDSRLVTSGVVLLVFLSFFAGLSSIPLFDVDEGAFSEATREMLISHNYLTTWLNGAPRFDKPILIYWLQLLSVRILGISELAFRLPSALAGAFWAAIVYFFVRKERNNTEALLVTALLALSLQVSIIAKSAIADALLNLFLAVALLSIFRYWRSGSRSSILIAWCATGFGMLTKGPVAILVPFAVSLLFFLLQKDIRRWFRAALDPVGIALFLAIALPWYLLEYREQGQAFIDGFFLKHNVRRFSNPMEGHSGSLLYYLPVLIVGIMPATGLLFSAIIRIRHYLADPLYRFCLIWFGFVFLFFSFSGTKLPHYLIYGYTPLFIILGAELAKARKPWLHALWPSAFLLILAILPPIFEYLIPLNSNLFVQAQLRGLASEMTGSRFSWVMTGAAILCLIIQMIPALAPPFRFIVGAAILNLSINVTVLPLVATVMQKPVKEAALFAHKAGLNVVMWKVFYPSFLVYSGSFAERRYPEPGDVVLTSIDHLEQLGPVEHLYQRHGIILARLPDQQQSR